MYFDVDLDGDNVIDDEYVLDDSKLINNNSLALLEFLKLQEG